MTASLPPEPDRLQIGPQVEASPGTLTPWEDRELVRINEHTVDWRPVESPHSLVIASPDGRPILTVDLRARSITTAEDVQITEDAARFLDACRRLLGRDGP